jgi:putative PEP-CTERM system TPR-repeat lipoprotein
MNRYSAPLATLLILSLFAPVAGCDSTARLTEQEHIQRAKDFEDKGQYKGSIVELKNALQKNPNSPQARLLLGQIYLKVGKGAEAEKELSKAWKLGVNGETIKPPLGEALLLMGEYKRVLDEINPGEQTSKPNLARIYQIRADAMLKQGQLKDACNLYQQSLDIDKENPPTYWGLAQCAVAEQDMARARSLLDDALKMKSRQSETWVFIGNLEQYDKNLQAALTAYTNALKSDPNNQEALQSRAALNMALGQLPAAQADIDKVTKLDPESIYSHYLHALLSFEQRKYPEARNELDKVFHITSDYMPSVLLAGATAYALDSYEQAESHLNRFLARFPHHAYALRVLAATQIRQRQPEKALKTLVPLIGPDGKDAAALALASEAYRVLGESAKSAEYLERAAATDPKNVAIQTQLGLTHLSTGDTQLAIAELGNAASLDSSTYRADILLVKAYLDRKEYDKALAAIDALEKKLQNSAITHTMRGNALFGKNDLPNARKSFEKALSIDPAFFPAAASLAELDLRDSKPDDARKRYERVLDKDRTNLQAMMALADLAAMNKQEKGYVSWLEKAAKAHPNAMQPRAALVRYYLAKREGQKALALANEAVNANPDNPAALDLLGSVQLANNDKTSATSTFTRLVQETNQSPDALLRLALAQVAENKLADGRTSLQQALKLKPDHPQSLDALIRLEIKEKNPEKALQTARQTQALLPNNPLGFEREGDILLYQSHPELAAKAYEKALAVNATSDGLIKLHRAQTLAGNAQAADQILGNWLKQHPADLAVRAYAAEYFGAHGRNKEAIDQYQAILQQSPQNPIALNNLAGLYQRAADSRALPTAEQALRLAPENPAIQDTLGWILVEQGQVGRGLELLNKALAKAPKNAGIRYHHAVALVRTGDKAQARKELESLLRDAPNFPEAKAVRAQLQGL